MGTHSTRARCQMARPAPPMLMSHSGMNGLGQNGPGPFSQIGVRSDSQAATRHAKSAKTTTDLGPADWLQNYHLPVARREWAVGDCRLWQISRTDCQSGPRCSATSGRGAAHVKLHPIFQLQGVAMKRTLLAIVAIGGLAAPAMAADMPVKYRPPPPAPVYFSWTGCYFGGNIGGLRVNKEITGPFGGSISGDASSWVGRCARRLQLSIRRRFCDRYPGRL